MSDAIERARQLTAEAEHLYSVTIRRKETLVAAREEAMRVTGEAASPDGSVQVTVDVGGMVTRLVLAPDALRLDAAELADLITSVIQQAATGARAAVHEVYAPLRDEGVVRDIPVLLPEPTPSVAPDTRPRRRSVTEDEAFNEDAPSMLRSEDW